MALVAHRMMLPSRHRRTHQQVARNKVGVLLVPSVADYYNSEQQLQQVQPTTTSPAPQLQVDQQQLQQQQQQQSNDAKQQEKVAEATISFKLTSIDK
ncbi:uncharacterized protein Dwil_GK14850 [Drosophila willistoni]|uniref:Uncharacterized protein n=1 Tax=Drosophila willistoni TaxID=7260 RepID=B4MWF1_DROWI|nr:uncharacterized protein Dwil_GK14850 [Drosophila willistoni]